MGSVVEAAGALGLARGRATRRRSLPGPRSRALVFDLGRGRVFRLGLLLGLALLLQGLTFRCTFASLVGDHVSQTANLFGI